MSADKKAKGDNAEVLDSPIVEEKEAKAPKAPKVNKKAVEGLRKLSKFNLAKNKKGVN